MNSRRSLPRCLVDPLIPFVFLAVAVAATWPLTARIATHLPGHTTDTLVHYWNGWWVGQALSDGESPFFTSLLFFPDGLDLVYHNFAWQNILGWLALRSLLGGFVAYNLTIIVSLAFCGFAAFLLARELIGHRGAAFLAGLIYLCWPYRFSQLDHPNLVSTHWIPLCLLYVVRTVRRGRWQDGVLAGLFLVLTGYTRWQQLLPLAIVGSLYLIFGAEKRLLVKRPQLLSLCLAGVVAFLAWTPALWLFVRQHSAAQADLLVDGEEAAMQTDLLAFVTPSSSHPVVGTLTAAAYDHYYADRSPGRRFAPYVGAVTLVLCVLGVWRARRASLPWLTMALVLIMMALGPILRINGQPYPEIPMPYRLLSKLFVVRLMRFPDRYSMFLALPVAMLASYGVSHLLQYFSGQGRWAQVIVMSVLGFGIWFEYWVVPAPLQDTQLSPYYGRMATEPGEYAVLNLPIDPQESKRYMFAQTIHHRPMLQGKTARLPDGIYAYLDSHPWLQALRQRGEMPPGLADVSNQLVSLANDNVRYIILHKSQVGADRLARWRRYLVISPTFEDEQIAVYAAAPVAGRDFSLAAEAAPGIGPVSILVSADCLNPGRVWAVDIAWGTTVAPEQDLDVRLSLVSTDGTSAQEAVFPASTGGSTGTWSANYVAWGYYALKAHPSLPQGVYTATVTLIDSGTRSDQGRPLVLGEVRVSQFSCDYPIPPQAIRANALFGDELLLSGYELNRERDNLSLTLFWRSEKQMEIDYKIFVHVFDPATGIPVAQDDAMPLRWSFPTTFWVPGEQVTDTIPVSLDQVSPGKYRVAVGVYDPVTLDRLPVLHGDGRHQSDGRFVLPGDTIEVE